MASLSSDFGRRELRFWEKVRGLSWGLVLLIGAAACFGVAILYSAADGSMDPWAAKQTTRFAVALILMMGVALVDIRNWFRIAYWAYAAGLVLVIAVDMRGFVGMGAQRWIDLGAIQLQPSALMNVVMVLALSRYFHSLSDDDIGRIRYWILPGLMVLVPAALVLKQPDLGTATMLLMGGASLFFIAGMPLRFLLTAGVFVAAALPGIWHFLRDYQKNRIYTFLDPDSDPLGAGYHILQSKIALGSGGLFGKGFLQGSQSHLSFLPEKQTDFIFTMLAEEFGLVGGLGLLILYSLIIAYGSAISLRSRNHFGRLLGLGIITSFFLYFFINTGMVMGLLPVVGVPLPLISYGGTAMLAVMFAFGLLINVGVHGDIRLSRSGESRPS